MHDFSKMAAKDVFSLVGKTCHFKSNCKIFKNFDVKGKVASCSMLKSGEVLMRVTLPSGRHIDIGSKMPNLKCDVL